jgi:hypothetical protein
LSRTYKQFEINGQEDNIMLKTKKNKTIAGVVSGCVALIAVMLIVNLAPDNRDAPTAAQAETTESAVTTTPITADNERHGD